ncbi:MAG: hypothetical protein ACKPKO_33800, partial [Candidatus Fonsibacter sp.]
MMAQRAELVERHTALLQIMRNTHTMDGVRELMPLLDSLEEDMERASEPLAFKSKSKGLDQWASCLAAGCLDEWTCIPRPDGCIKAAFRS